MTRAPAPPPARETRPCVVCRREIEAGASYVVTARGPVHARHPTNAPAPRERPAPTPQ